MPTIQSSSINVDVPDADPGAVNMTIPAGSVGPISLTLFDADRSLRVQLLEINNAGIVPAPYVVEGGQQVVLFEAGEIVGPAHGYAVWHDNGAGGDEDATLVTRSRA